jgi:hypothetical protein
MSLSTFSKTSREYTTWAKNNFGKVFLGDIRRTLRLVSLAETMAEKPGSSLAKLGKTWYDTKAIYNLMKHKHMRPDIIQSNHRLLVEKEIEQSKNDVLLIEDGSELSWSGNEPIKGLGPVGSGHSSDQGFIIQSVLAVEMVPANRGTYGVNNTIRPPVRILGLIDQQYYIRPPKLDKTRRRRNTDEAIETDLWRNTLERLPTFNNSKRIIRVCDRAADIYEVIIETQAKGLNYVIRSSHNRTIENETDVDGNPIRLFDHKDLKQSKASYEVILRGRDGKKSQNITLQVSWVAMTTRAPSRPGYKAGELPPLEYSVVRAWQETEPTDPAEEKIEWFLLTNIAVENELDAIQIIKIYCTRWTIEDYHKALKSGLGAEKLQLESAEALMAAVSVMSVVALRLVDIRERLRITPDDPASESGLDELELKILSKYLKRELKTVRCVGLALGRLGGHLNRKQDGMPGIITLWRGLSQLIQLVQGAQIALELINN